MKKQPFLYTPFADIAFICMPPFICLLCIFLFPTFFISDAISDWWWLFLVIGIDVTHVYTTLYKTYGNRDNFNKHKTAFLLIPFICFTVAFCLYAFGAGIFWKLLAYTAVFHFIRQQYGFVRLYSRYETNSISKLIDSITIYSATVFPILYWHCYGPFEFNWFVKNDFTYFKNKYFITLCNYLYFTTIMVWLCKEIYFLIKHKSINLPKVLVIIGTYVSWYFGIVYYNSDMTFSLLNIVSHGIPYIALIWFDQHREQQKTLTLNWFQKKNFYSIKRILFFLAIPLILAFAEEYFWNIFNWQEKRIFFYSPKLQLSKDIKQLLIPLLILPQLIHYVIDGFIWKVSKGHIST